MQIAKVTDGIIEQVDDYRVFFPNTSFASGPTPEFLAEMGFLPVSTWLSHNSDTHKLVEAKPYIDSGSVYTVETLELSQQELAEKETAKIAERSQLRSTAYQQESDPIFFKMQRGEATIDEWLAKIAEIKSRYS